MKLFSFCTLLSCLCMGAALAQQPHSCGTDAVYNEQKKNDPEIGKREIQANSIEFRSARKVTNRSNIIIPVVVHVFHQGGSENISKAQVQDAIRLLNLDFQRLNADTSKTRAQFKGVASGTNIEFRLASLDPKGHCTEGIVRYQTPLTENGDDEIKLLSTWPTDHYFNIWVVKNIAPRPGAAGTILGYAQFPWSGLYRTDGVIMRHDMMGDIGTAASPQGLPRNYGRTLTHETGHWLGLFHTFQGGCGDDDRLDDTPPTANPNYNICLPSMLNSCHADNPDLPDQYENYMDYSTGSCQNMFSAKQCGRMLAFLDLNVSRAALHTPENHAATGITGSISTCAPVADFISGKSFCTGDAVQFSDMSYQGSGNYTYNWHFPGGSPEYSTAQNPVVTYAVAGIYPVELMLSNTDGKDTLLRTNQVGIWNKTTLHLGSLSESFEGDKLFYGWNKGSNSAGTWYWTTSAAASGTHSYMIYNNSWMAGTVHTIETNNYDLSGQSATFNFKYAFARRNKTNGISEDRMTVRYSTDCGSTWVTKYVQAGANLATTTGNSVVTYDFYPPSSTEWRLVNIDLATFNKTQLLNIKFKIEFESDGGNNFFLDDINFAQVLSTTSASSAGISFYPNPANEQLNLQLPAYAKGEVIVDLLDLSGKKVAQL